MCRRRLSDAVRRLAWPILSGNFRYLIEIRYVCRYSRTTPEPICRLQSTLENPCVRPIRAHAFKSFVTVRLEQSTGSEGRLGIMRYVLECTTVQQR